MKKVLVAGATGYLGKYLLEALNTKGYYTVALARDSKKLSGSDFNEVISEEVTKPESLKGICDGIDIVISTVGITRQKDGLIYMDVDYQANLNLLKEAIQSKVKKFIYVSVLNGQYLKNLKMVAAKERFVDELKSSGLNYCVIRPNGFFSDMTEVLDMAKKGSVYLFGNGEYKANPIHGADLANYMVENINSTENELDIGGPDLLTQNEIAEIAFKVLDKTPKISHLPIWIKNIIVALSRFFTSQKTYGPVEFFMTVMTMDMVAPCSGKRHLEDFYREIMARK